MNNRSSIAIIAACIFLTHWRADAIEESGLIGSWRTAGDSSSTYTFAKDHSVTEMWYPKDQPAMGNIMQGAARLGHWKLDGEQLVITMESECVPGPLGKGTIVQLSSEQGTTSWTIVYDTRYTMIWSNTTSRAGVSRSVELELRRVGGPLIAIKGRELKDEG